MNSSQNLPADFAGFWSRHPYRSAFAGQLEWRYVDTDNGEPTILMLPGGSYRPDNYFKLICGLAVDFRVIAPAYPPVSPLSELISGLAAVLDSAQQARVTVFGCSFGGYVAQALVKELPDRVDALILAQTATRHFAGLRTMRMFSALFAALPLPIIRAFTWRLWTRWFFAQEESREFWFGRLRSELAEMIREQHVAGARNIVDFMVRYHPAPRWLEPWHGPTLLLESLNDQAFSAEQRKELRDAYPGSVVRTLNAGHTALFTDSDLFVREIRDFMRRVSTSKVQPRLGVAG
jgi:pimeloyl-ACP methyl ester carboxylesterase